MRTPPLDDLQFSNTTGILPKKKTMWFIGVEVEQETSAPPPKKNPGSAPGGKAEVVKSNPVPRGESLIKVTGIHVGKFKLTPNGRGMWV